MMPGMVAPVAPVGVARFSSILSSLGLASNLKLCLDAGDAASYTSGQSWLDRSGGGYDFFLGAGGSADGADPTFNGTPGGLSSSEYFSFDGGDNFTYDTTNETWMQNLHKDNAAFWMMAWVYFGGTQCGIMGTGADSTDIGVNVFTDGSRRLRLRVGRGGSNALAEQRSDSISDSTWVLTSVLVNEASSSVVLGVNDNFQSFASAYSSPSASNAAHTMQLGATGNNTNRLKSGSRMAGMMMGEGGVLTTAQVTNFYEATRGRFGV
jgi:hypothetical protein